MFTTNNEVTANLIKTVRRGLERIERNEITDLEELHKTLRVMASVCDKAAKDVKTVLELC